MKITANIHLAATSLASNLSSALAYASSIGPMAAYIARQSVDPAVDLALKQAVREIQDKGDFIASQFGPLLAKLAAIIDGELVPSQFPTS